MKNGFTMINFLFLIPLFFICCLTVVGSYQLILKYTEIQKTCRTQVLKTQKILGEKLTILMDLNPQAQLLRAEEKRLRAAIVVALAVAPPTAIPLQNLLELNLFRQGLLRGQQEKIILNATTEAKRAISDLNFPRGTDYNYSGINLKIYKTPLAAIAPDHLPLPFFSDVQTITVKWKIKTNKLLPELFLSFFPGKPQVVEGKCGATLTKKGHVWNPKLHLAKF